MSTIIVNELTKTFQMGKVRAVESATFDVKDGECFGLIGPNGAGKTTIFGCLLALMHPTSGQIKIDGRSPFDLTIKPLIGFLPERPCYNRWMTIKQFLAYQHWLSERPSSEREAEIKRVISLVELDVDISKRRVKECSRGMLQRVGFAQALIGHPKIFFLDEPTSGMDPLGFILMRKLLIKCKEDGMTVVLNSHHLQEVEKVCDRIAFIRKGKIEAVEKVSELALIRQTLNLGWLENTSVDVAQILAKITETLGCALLSCENNQAKFSVPDNEKAAEIVAALSENGLRVYQSNFEKRELVELFLTDPKQEVGQ